MKRAERRGRRAVGRRWRACVGGAVAALCVTASFARGDSVVVFNEIMYHPASGESTLEWIELHNELAYDVDLSGWSIGGGVDYAFAVGTIIPGNGYLVIAADPEALAAAGACANALGPFVGQLSNSGEELELHNNGGRLMNVLDYRDGGDWPVPPDGSGASLARLRRTGNNDPESWSWSAAPGGTPGALNFAQDQAPSRALVINELDAATNAAWWLELANLGAAGTNPAGCVVSVAGDPAREYVVTNTWLAPGGLLLIPAAAGLHPAVDEPVFLHSANRQSVLDGRVAKAGARGRMPEPDGRWLRPGVATPGAANVFNLQTNIVINEIMYHQHPQMEPYAESLEQWIELFNRGTQTVDLSGWQFTDGITWTFATGTVMTAGTYRVVAWDTNAMALMYPALGGALCGPFSGRLSHSGERIRLEDAAGNPAAEVHYQEGGRWSADADGYGPSLELRDPWADGAMPEAWAASDEASKVGWRTYTNRGLAVASSAGNDNQWREFVMGLLDHGEALIDDVSVIENPGGPATEFIQNGSFAGDTVGGGAAKWRIIGTHRHSVVAADPDNPSNRCLRLIATDPTEHMHNHAETTFAGGRSVNNFVPYSISFKARWVTGSRQLNTRVYFNRLPKTFLLDVPERTGTPGAVNSRYAGNIGPTFAGLVHAPAVPAGGEPIEVFVTVADPQGVAGVTNWYAVNEGAWTHTTMSPAGNGLYRGVIPGQATGSVVQFYVEARDAQGVAACFPAAGRDSRALIRVQDGQAATNGLHNLRITMLPSEAAWMHAVTNQMSNDRLGATVLFDEQEIFYDAAVRLKGSEHHRSPDSDVGFNIQFDPGLPFRGTHTGVSLDRSQGSGFGQREMISRLVQNRVGGPGSWYSDLVKVIAPRSVNSSAAELQMARYGSVFLDEQFADGSDGSQYEMEFIYYPTTTDNGTAEGNKLPLPDGLWMAGLADLGADKERYRWVQLAKNNTQRDDFTGMIAFSKVVNYGNPAFNNEIGQYIDVDEWLRYMALGISDGTTDDFPQGTMHNVIFHFRPEDGRVLCLQYDHDYGGNVDRPLISNPYLLKLVQEPANDRALCGHMLDVLNTAYNTNYLGRWLEQFTQLLGSIAPPQDFNSYAAFIQARHDFLAGEVAGRVAAAYPFTVTTPDQSIAADRIELAGNGWIDVYRVYMDGLAAPLTLTWTSNGQLLGPARRYIWHATVPLQPGANSLTLRAYDFQGNAVGSDTVTITNTISGWPLGDGLRVTELMFDPPEGSACEFIELRNIGPSALDLSAVRLANAVTFSFAGSGVTNLPSNGYVVVVADRAAFAAKYNTNGMTIAGPYAGKFANEGETVEVLADLGRPVLSFQYGSGRGWPAAVSGAGHALVPLDRAMADQPLGSLDYGGNWRAGAYIGGSPGGPDPAPPPGPVLNEIMAHTDVLPPYESDDWIELYNPTDATVPLTDGWYLSDDALNLKKWQIPATNAIGARGWLWFDEITGFHTGTNGGFGLDKKGEQVFLSHLPGNANDRVADAVAFKAQERTASLGRYPDGGAWWQALEPPTTNAANAPPAPRVVIRQIMYHPQATPSNPESNTGDEYVEIFNPTTNPVAFVGEGGPWRLDGAVQYTFPTGLVLSASGVLVVAPFDPSDAARMQALVNVYGPTDAVQQVLGPWAGQLSDRGERLALERSMAGDLPGDPSSWVIVDEAIYFHRAPWPEGTDGTGRPLRRTDAPASGNDPAAWEAGARTLHLELHWMLDENAGLTATDDSGHGNTGTLLAVGGGAPPAWGEGASGSALAFNGVNDVVRHDGAVAPGYPFTLTAWVRTTDAAAQDRCAVFIGGDEKLYAYHLIGVKSGKAEIVAHVSASPYQVLSAAGATVVADGRWHHLAGVFLNGTTKQLYVDGALEATLTAEVSFTGTPNRVSAGLCDRSSIKWGWLGSLDDVRVYYSALYPDETLKIMAEGQPRRDSDGDGMPDAWEQKYFGGTNVVGGEWGADWDHDGALNGEEYTAGTNPTNPASRFALGAATSNGAMWVGFDTVIAEGQDYTDLHRFYAFEQLSSLPLGNWSGVEGSTNIPATGQPVFRTLPEPGTNAIFGRGKVWLN